MKCLMLIKHSQRYRVEDAPQALLNAMGTVITRASESGVLKDTARLKPTAEGHRVRPPGR
jgi:hypothetical protein